MMTTEQSTGGTDPVGTDPIATCHIWADVPTVSFCVVRVFSSDVCAAEIYSRGARAVVRQCTSLESALDVAHALKQQYLG